ncbi:MCM DNA helicase complex subunit [Coemansia sp. RSA 988]|nr:MCM DNA helicase complex subunit [Coemansia sp. RSA 988]
MDSERMEATPASEAGGDTRFTLPEAGLAEDQFLERQRHCREYLERDNRVNADIEELERVAGHEKPRVIISIDHIREFDSALAERVVAEPGDYIPAFEAAAAEVGAGQAGAVVDEAAFRVAVGFCGAFGAHHLTPRGLRARHLGQLVCIEGIVTRCSLVRPKVVRSVHYSEATKTFFAKTYRDQTSSGAGAGAGGFSSAYPTTDDKGNPLTTEYGYSRYMDHQTVNVQEMPERAPPGQLPRGVDVVLDDDLVDVVKPGDRVSLVGVYRALGGKATTAASAIFRTAVIVGSVRVFGAGSLAAASSTAAEINAEAGAAGVPGGMRLTDADIRNIHEVGRRADVFELVAGSVAPSISGHAEIKRALVLQQLGGVEKNLENGTHIRGDINVMMVGDPSTAKSQVLRYVLRIAPLAIATTGRGSSGVGLTAAVVADKDTGERRLEAGAMVLADRGVVCIDEFDKMTDVDRVAIHEVMEQQTVTVAKAGIHTTLNARCSVLAAANPVYGRYDPRRPPHQNIALPDSLLSRFDLLFVVTDSMDEARDRAISAHVLRMHRYVPPGTEPGQPVADLLDYGLGSAQLLASFRAADAMGADADADPSSDAATRPCRVFEPYNEYLHAGVAPPPPRRTRSRSRRAVLAAADTTPRREVLSTEFLRRFLYFARNMVRPVLAADAADDLAAVYAELRAQASGQGLDGHGATGPVQTTTPVTARTLETLIRLATAHAKLRLSPSVEAQDAEVAKTLLRFALFKEKPAAVPRPSTRVRHKQKRVRTSDDSASDGEPPVDVPPAAEPMDVDLPASSAPTSITADRLALFKAQLNSATNDQSLDRSSSTWSFPDPFMSIINASLAPTHREFTLSEAEHALLSMQDENRLMFRDNMIIMI